MNIQSRFIGPFNAKQFGFSFMSQYFGYQYTLDVLTRVLTSNYAKDKIQ